MRSQHRSGLTLLELIIVLAVTLTLLMLVVPALRNARTDGRGRECLNNVKQTSLALMNFASANKSRIPARSYYLIREDISPGQSMLVAGRSWAVEILPYLDSNSTYDRWDFEKNWNSNTTNEAGDCNQDLAGTYKFCFVCPEDESSLDQPGGLSYVINSGVGDFDYQDRIRPDESGARIMGHHFAAEPFDWDGDGLLPPDDLDDMAVTNDLGVSWPHFSTATERPWQAGLPTGAAIGKMYDGTSNTLLLAENINAGPASGSGFRSWADPRLSNCGFFLPVRASEIGPQVFAETGGLNAVIDYKPISPLINAAGQNEGHAPFPNSNHAGVVVVSFCDGSAKSISEEIDPGVYAKLITPAGTRLREKSIPGFASEGLLNGESF